MKGPALRGLEVGPAEGSFPGDAPVEVVERKGLGHPDSICDALAERVSLALSALYRETFGLVLHHNVDKALLWAGRAEPAFGDGVVKEPMEIFLSGRAARRLGGRAVEVDELIVETARSWLRDHLHALNPDLHVRLRSLVRPGSRELVELFARQQRDGTARANDSSCGVGFAPLTTLERVVLEVEREISALGAGARPAVGEDVKVLGIRRGDRLDLTISAALIGRFLPDLQAYRDETEAVTDVADRVARRLHPGDVGVTVNAADDVDAGSVYLTVTGTSAEAGDDGQAGRGNRANGLITPYRPMVMESWAGKNPISHPGKVYSVVAQEIAEAAWRELPGASHVECHLVSRIGARLDDPELAHVRVGGLDRDALSDARSRVEEITCACLAGAKTWWQRALGGEEVLG